MKAARPRPCYGWKLGDKVVLFPSAKRIGVASKDAPSGASIGIWNDEENRFLVLRKKA